VLLAVALVVEVVGEVKYSLPLPQGAVQVQVGLLLLKNFTDLRIQNAKHILS
jgi:hypothetical protein